jgi:hypothetical protein
MVRKFPVADYEASAQALKPKHEFNLQTRLVVDYEASAQALKRGKPQI